MSLIEISNDGKLIKETNYFQSEYAQNGYFLMSINDGAFRLLTPDQHVRQITELKTCKEVIISRGPWPESGKHDAFEILFEDESQYPFSIHLIREQFMLLPADCDRNKLWTFSAWSKDGLIFELPCYYRIVKRLPWLKPYTGKR